MSLTSIIRYECPKCNKAVNETSRLVIGRSTIIKLSCGHIKADESLAPTTAETYDSIVFSDGCKPRPYQIDAIKFGEKANCRFILADEQGLGKTIEVFSLVRLHPDKLLPLVYICPTTIKLQVMREIHRICGNGPEFLTQVIQSGKEKALPGFKIYIVTYDMLKNEDMFTAFLPKNHIQTVIIDECQRVKNHLSDRAKAVQRIARNAPHIIPMSGSPIYNNAGEYFTVLNLVDPLRFGQHQGFLNKYCDTYETFYATKVGGLKDANRFHEDTKDIIIRRVKSDVLPDLPPLDRKFFHVEFKKELYSAYRQQLEELESLLYDNSSAGGTAKIAIMGELRHLTGLSKVDECVDFVTEFLLSTDRKIVVFLHHLDVASQIQMKLDSYLSDGNFAKCLNLHSGLSGNERSNLVETFKTSSARVMIASTQAAGEGLNLQFCSDAVMLERQWNPPREEQAEARFHRFGQLNAVSVTYMIASETIDEYFTELVERKRAIIASVMDNKTIEWEENSLMKELAEILVTKGKDKWKL